VIRISVSLSMLLFALGAGQLLSQGPASMDMPVKPTVVTQPTMPDQRG